MKHRASAIFFQMQPYLKNVIRGKNYEFGVLALACECIQNTNGVRSGCGWSNRQDLEHE